MYIIYSATETALQDEPMYWNNKTGWGSRATAEVFPSNDFNLPLGGEWELLPVQESL